MSENLFAPETCHEHWIRALKQSLSFAYADDYAVWREQLREKFLRVLGDMPEKPPLNPRDEQITEHDSFIEKRVVFTAEAGADIPAHLLLPKSVSGKIPAVICLQGHTTGMHISLGREKYQGDAEMIGGGDRDFALQAVRLGYAALALEQRAFGERVTSVGAQDCTHPSMAALLLGRTMLGERVWDVSRSIDFLETQLEIDASRIGCMGNSGGGTVTYYAAAADERIRVAMPSCSVCTYWDSIGSIFHCPDNYLPGAMKYFDMSDIAALITPRKLIVVAGRDDDIFPIDGVKRAYENIRNIFRAAGAPDHCQLVVGEGGHRFYAADSWPVFRAFME